MLPTGQSLEEYASSGINSRDIELALARSNVLNARSYVRGDGSDETAALQGLLGRGKPVYFPGGYVYGFSGNLTITSDIWGDGWSTIFEARDNTVGNYKSMLYVATDNVCLRDFQYRQTYGHRVAITSTNASGSTLTVVTATPHLLTTGDGVQLYGITPADHQFQSKAVTVVNETTFTVSGTFTAGAGSIISATRGAYVKRTRDNQKVGIIVQGVTGGLIENVLIEGSRGAGISLQAVNDYTVQDNTVSDTGADGIIQISSAVFTGNINVKVLGNTVRNPGDDGISVDGFLVAAAEHKFITIANNTIYGGFAYGATSYQGGSLRIAGATGVSLHGNKQKDCFGSLIIGYDVAGTYPTKDVTVHGHYSDTCGVVANAMGALKIIGNATYPTSNIHIDGFMARRARYRSVFTTGGATADVKGLILENLHLIDCGYLTDTDATTGANPAVEFDRTEDITFGGRTRIESCGTYGIVFDATVSGQITLGGTIMLSGVNQAGSASVHGIIFSGTSLITEIGLGNIYHDTQAGTLSTSTMTRLILFNDSPGNKVNAFGRQISWASANVTTKIPNGSSLHNGNQIERLLFAATVDMASLGDTAMTDYRPYAGTFLVTRVIASRASGAFNTNCQLDIRTATGGGGSLVAQTTAGGGSTEIKTLTGADTAGVIPVLAAAGGGQASAYPPTVTALQARVTTANSAALTAGVYVYGIQVG